MAEMNMNFTDSITYIQSTTKLLKEMRRTLDAYMDTMPLPEDIDKITRGNIKIWVHHYMNGKCTMDSLKNIMREIGVADLLAEPFHELEVSKDGKVTVYDIGEN